MKYFIRLVFGFVAALSLGNIAYAENYNDRFISEKSPVIAFTNARLIDGTGAAVKENQTVVIRDGRITKIGRDGQVNIPKDAKQISLKGKSLLPGWVMLHEHLFYGGSHKYPFTPKYANQVFIQQSVNYPRLFLAAGVTSARTVGSIKPYNDLSIKRAIDEGDLVGPDFDLTAPFLTGPTHSLEMYPLKNTKEVRETVRYWARLGFTSFKAYGYISDDNLAAAIDEAHKLGLKITGDLTTGNSIQRHTKAIDLGIEQLEHIVATMEEGVLLDVEDQKVQRMIQHYIDNNVAITSTLPIYEVKALPTEELSLLTEASRKEWLLLSAPNGAYSTFEPMLNNQLEVIAEFWRKGGKLTVGSDPARPGVIAGYGNLRAIELLAKAGIPPLEVIKIATQNGAEVMGIAADRGIIEIGKRADLIVVNGDPSSDISAIHNIETVFKNGIGYNPEALKESVKGTVGGPG